MALGIKDKDGQEKYVQALGAGTVGDPFVLARAGYGVDKDGNLLANKCSPSGTLYSHPDPHDIYNSSIHLTRDTGTTDTLAVAASKDDKSIEVNNGAQFADGNKLRIFDATLANSEFDFVTIKGAPVGNVLTLDRRLDADHPIGTSIVHCTPGMNVDGSSTNVIHELLHPGNCDLFHIHSIQIVMASSGEPSLEKFGGISTLVNGLHFRVYNPSGRHRTFGIPFRTNNSFVLTGFSYVKEPKVGVTWYVHLKYNTIDTTNSVFLIDNLAGEKFQAIIQDDLSGLLALETKASIHDEC